MREPDCASRSYPPVLSRRELLRLSGMGFGSLALAYLLSSSRPPLGLRRAYGSEGALDGSPKSPHFPAQAKAVIQLVQTGGPSHVDLFDPKPELQKRNGQTYEVKVDGFQPGSEANKLLGSPFKFAPRGQSGMEMSEVIPHMYEIADEICLVRSQVGEHNNHTEAMVLLASGKIFLGRPTLGAWISYGLGTENENLPAFVVLRDPDGYATSGGLMSKSGWLPALYAGTEFNSRGAPVHNLTPAEALPEGVQRRGLSFLARLNAKHREQYPYDLDLETRIRNYELAARMQLEATSVLDISKETEETKKLYGLENPLTASYGIRCLMARRLVEAGVRFVQVFTGVGQPWDHHGGLKAGLEHMGRRDLPSAGLIRDLKNRGLLETTIVLWAGEFGRNPIAQGGTDGRDHNKDAGSLWLAGGGFKKGCVHGATDEVGHKATTDRMTMPDLFATIAHQVGLDHREVIYRHSGRDETMTDYTVTGAHIHAGVIEKPLFIDEASG
ncbi:MAG: DUF1501 domain-containing protein [Planctomycetes bacterium]|nr:DUF1501 domain-containing protein [Planctomycetota bacterium]